MFRSWAASVKLADEINTASPSTTMHLAWRHARFSSSNARERGSQKAYGSGRS